MTGRSATFRRSICSIAIGLMTCSAILGTSIFTPGSAFAASGVSGESSPQRTTPQEMLSGGDGHPSIPGTRVSMGGYSILLPEGAWSTQAVDGGVVVWQCEDMAIFFMEGCIIVDDGSKFGSYDFKSAADSFARELGGSGADRLASYNELPGCPVYAFWASKRPCVIVFLPRADGVCDGMVFAIPGQSDDEWRYYLDSMVSSIRPVSVELLGSAKSSDALSDAYLGLIGQLPAMGASGRSAVRSVLEGQAGPDSVLQSLNVMPLEKGGELWTAGVVSTNDTGVWSREQMESLLLTCGIDGLQFDDPRDVYRFTEFDGEGSTLVDSMVTGTYDCGEGERSAWGFIAVQGSPLVMVTVRCP